MRWDWNEEKTRKWLEPAIEAYYLSHRWCQAGFRRLLDNGCGPGRHAVFFAGQGLEVTGLDQSREALHYLSAWAQRESLQVEAVEGSLFQLPFPDGSFDCVMDYNASYHTDTAGYRQALSELRRVLKPGGEVYMTLLSQNDPGFAAAPPEAHLDRFTLIHEDGTPHFYGRPEDFGDLFQGFSMALPPREIRTQGPGSSKESVHYHLLLRKEPL